MKRTPALRDHVAAGLLDIAAGVLAERGDASMIDIAKAAGVARATLYRYFPSKEALVQALYETAMADLTERIAEAKLDDIPVEEAIARLTRAVLAAARKYQALALFEKSLDTIDDAKTRLVEPFQTLFERATRDGVFRTDLPTQTLLETHLGLLQSASTRVNRGLTGAEEASAAITTIFLTGALSDPTRR